MSKRPKPWRNPSILHMAAVLFRRGESVRSVARSLGISYYAARKCARTLGIRIEERRHRPTIQGDLAELLVALRLAGWTRRAIEDYLCIPCKHVDEFFERHGVRPVVEHRVNTCVACGVAFEGGPKARYCSDCKRATV